MERGDVIFGTSKIFQNIQPSPVFQDTEEIDQPQVICIDISRTKGLKVIIMKTLLYHYKAKVISYVPILVPIKVVHQNSDLFIIF